MAIKYEFNSRFEEDESTIRDRMLSDENLTDYRKEPGDYVYDVVAPVPAEIIQLQANQDAILMSAFAQYATDEDLDEKMYERGLTREPATPNKRQLSITSEAGVVIPTAYTLTSNILDEEGNPLEYTVDEGVTFATAGALTVNLTAVLTGVITNIPTGSTFILQPPIPGVNLIEDLGTTIPGQDQEDNETAFLRYEDAILNPDTGGNKSDYSRWSLDVEGVGKVQVIPRWNGNGTVKVIAVDTEMAPASQTILDNLQETLDPGSTGLGDGKAPLGAKVTVVAATALTVNVSATITLLAGYTLQDVTTAFTDTLKAYLKERVLESNAAILYNQVAGLLITTAGVTNYSNLLINSGTADIAISEGYAPAVGSVTFA